MPSSVIFLLISSLSDFVKASVPSSTVPRRLLIPHLVLLSQDSTGETIDTGSASVTEGYNYCTSNWQAEVSLLSSPSGRRLQTSTDEYTAPVIPDVIPTDVEEVRIHVVDDS